MNNVGNIFELIFGKSVVDLSIDTIHFCIVLSFLKSSKFANVEKQKSVPNKFDNFFDIGLLRYGVSIYFTYGLQKSKTQNNEDISLY